MNIALVKYCQTVLNIKSPLTNLITKTTISEIAINTNNNKNI